MNGGTSAASRPRLFLIITSIVFALWIAAMVVMYITTVYPQPRSGSTRPAAVE